MAKNQGSRMIPNTSQLPNMVNGIFGKFTRVLELLNVSYGLCFGVEIIEAEEKEHSKTNDHFRLKFYQTWNLFHVVKSESYTIIIEIF